MGSAVKKRRHAFAVRRATLTDRSCRAESVASYLASRGVVRARMATRGFGESQLLVNPEVSEADRAANRRVEIKVVPLRQ